MIPNIVKGSGISGALRYATGEGNDPKTGKRLSLVPGETSRAEILGGQGFGFDIDTPERLELARRIMEWQAAPENQASRTKPCVKDCLHMSLSWDEHQEPSKTEMIEAAESASIRKPAGPIRGGRPIHVKAHGSVLHAMLRGWR